MGALLDFAPADSTTVQKVNGHFPAASPRRSFRLLQLQILFLEGGCPSGVIPQWSLPCGGSFPT